MRIAALDELGLPLGRYSDSGFFQIDGIPSPADSFPFGFIDLPPESSVTEGPLSVEGWALDDHGVARIEVFVDRSSVGLAVSGRPRPDVRQVFPSFPNADTSGYRLDANISQLQSGTHTILVELTDTVGQKTLLDPRTITLSNGGNVAPFGNLDVPPPGTVAGSYLEIGVGRWMTGLFPGWKFS